MNKWELYPSIICSIQKSKRECGGEMREIRKSEEHEGDGVDKEEDIPEIPMRYCESQHG